jgi:hypothetical protein
MSPLCCCRTLRCPIANPKSRSQIIRGSGRIRVWGCEQLGRILCSADSVRTLKPPRSLPPTFLTRWFGFSPSADRISCASSFSCLIRPLSLFYPIWGHYHVDTPGWRPTGYARYAAAYPAVRPAVPRISIRKKRRPLHAKLASLADCFVCVAV